jgi:hypothetical protein
MQTVITNKSPKPFDKDDGRDMYEADRKVMASVDKMLGIKSST